MIKLTIQQIFEQYLHEYGKTDYAGYGLNPQEENGIVIDLKNGDTIEYTIDAITCKSSAKIMLSKKEPKQFGPYIFKCYPFGPYYTKDEVLDTYCKNFKSCRLGCVLCTPCILSCIKSQNSNKAIDKLIKADIIEEVK